MKFLDLLRMSSSNLWKRKVRTILTVLGVVIGVASIVVMISLGLGLSRSLLEEYESYGSVTQISVYESYYYGGDSSQEEKRLDDELIETISRMDHVKAVYPVLETNVIAKCGAYQNQYLMLRAMPIEALEGLNMEVGDGSLPSASDSELKFFYGSQNLQDFTNARGDGYYSTGELPDIDLMNDPVFVIFDRDAYWNAQYPSESGTAVAPPKKYMIETCGIEKTSEEGWTNWGWYTFCDIEKLIPELKRIFKNKVIPGQPSTKTGKPYKEIFYNQLVVDIDSMDNVTTVQALINEMGYQANSNAEWIESEQKTLGYVQMVLGGIGAVSLFVAAIGITNTMMMSIYERTKEIGVMKVLGCDLRNIRSLFLLEAGFIGFIGGIIGLALSYTLSIVINKLAAGADGGMMMTGSSISYIPLWLAGLALVFAVLVGMLAGFFPALRAMRLSPLAAIRTE
ncbi:MAG: ABC transporter permease [Bacillus sp. (in: Bacteria)]|nr:ABC transporter permease [Bacillus sp. (in: firmicutes)]MCM1426323.1 ABC transporter permease [Eubacterium sp.]